MLTWAFSVAFATRQVPRVSGRGDQCPPGGQAPLHHPGAFDGVHSAAHSTFNAAGHQPGSSGRDRHDWLPAPLLQRADEHDPDSGRQGAALHVVLGLPDASAGLGGLGLRHVIHHGISAD